MDIGFISIYVTVFNSLCCHTYIYLHILSKYLCFFNFLNLLASRPRNCSQASWRTFCDARGPKPRDASVKTAKILRRLHTRAKTSRREREKDAKVSLARRGARLCLHGDREAGCEALPAGGPRIGLRDRCCVHGRQRLGGSRPGGSCKYSGI